MTQFDWLEHENEHFDQCLIFINNLQLSKLFHFNKIVFRVGRKEAASKKCSSHKNRPGIGQLMYK